MQVRPENDAPVRCRVGNVEPSCRLLYSVDVRTAKKLTNSLPAANPNHPVTGLPKRRNACVRSEFLHFPPKAVVSVAGWSSSRASNVFERAV